MKITVHKKHKMQAPSQGKTPQRGKPIKILFFLNQIKVRYPSPMTNLLDAMSNPPSAQQIHQQQETSNKSSKRVL